MPLPVIRRATVAGLSAVCVLSLAASALAGPASAGPVPVPAAALPADSPAVVGLGIAETQDLLSSGTTTSVALVQAYLARIEAYDDPYGDQPGLNAIIRLNDSALAEAAALDAERAAGTVRGPLHGVPILVKDNYDTGDLPTTSASVALQDFQPADDATQVARLRAAGAIVLAKTNLHEFAYGITTNSSLGGQTTNPYDQTRNPGGSSGGTGSGVGASFAAGGMGTDTCGSIRYPAAHQNLVGLRPTLGLTSRDGIAPMSETQDTGGPIVRSVRDAAIVLDATVGVDPKDPRTQDSVGKTPESYEDALDDGLDGKRVGLLVNSQYLGTTEAEEPVTDLVDGAVVRLEQAGADVTEVALSPDLIADIGGASVLAQEFRRDLNAYLAQPGATYPAELAALTAPADVLTLSDIIATETSVVQSQITGAQNQPELPSADYETRLAKRASAQAKLAELLEVNDLDALVYPTLKQTAAPIGQSQPGGNCSISAVTGFPALTVPAGFVPSGMPMGLELLGAPFSEETLLAIGAGFEATGDYQEPPASTPELAVDAVRPVGLTGTATTVAFGAPTTVTATVTSAVRARGTVQLRSGSRVLASAPVAAQGVTTTVRLRVPGGRLSGGATRLVLAFAPSSGNATGAAQSSLVVRVTKAAPRARVVQSARLRVGRKAQVRLRLEPVAGLAPRGVVVMRVAGRPVGRATVRKVGNAWVADVRTSRLRRAGSVALAYQPGPVVRRSLASTTYRPALRVRR
ncbi:amidase family protein [Nocardioides sp. C4-1]|uniref:amidase n=1 Tax=Nocardioides sp. C4-1 TaxID=3151851 RepID=UPI0032649249